MSLSEAQKVLAMNDIASSTPHKPPRVLMPTVLQIMKEHYKTADMDTIKTAVDQLVFLDRTSIDSALVSLCRISAETPSTPHQTEESNETSSPSGTRNVLLEVIERFSDSMHIREGCCRALANMSLLSLPQETSEEVKRTDVAEQLVEDGAVLIVLDTMQRVARTPVGAAVSMGRQGWVAMALLNLLCLSQTGLKVVVGEGETAAATTRGVASLETIARYLSRLMLENDSVQPKESTFPAQKVAAADAAVGALTVILQSEAPENARRVSTFAALAPFTVIKAIMETLLFASAELVRDGRNSGFHSAILPKTRTGLQFRLQDASPDQANAIITLLPLLHKCWMALRLLCRHPENVPLVGTALEACVQHEGKEQGEPDGHVTVQLSVNALLDSTTFLLTELEGLNSVKPFQDSLPIVHEELCEAAMDVFSLLSRSTEEGEAAVGSRRGGVEGAVSESASGKSLVYDVMRSGTISSVALSTVVRVHAELTATVAALSPSSWETSSGAGAGYPPRAHSLLMHGLITLHQLIAGTSNVHDEVVVSNNMVAATSVMLRSGLEVLESVAHHAAGAAHVEAEEGDGASPSHVVGELGCLFLPKLLTAEEEKGKEELFRRREALSMLFLQEAAVLGQVCSILFSLLKVEAGAKILLEDMIASSRKSLSPASQVEKIGILELVTALHRCLRDPYAVALEKAQKFQSEHSSGSVTVTKMEETLLCLKSLCEKLEESLNCLKATHERCPA